MTAKQKIAEYKFKDDIEGIDAIIGLHLFFFMLYFLFGGAQLYDIRPLICLIIALIYWTVKRYYDWTSYRINILLVALYVCMCIVEWMLVGIPVVGYLENGYRFNKGIMLDFCVAMTPYIYVVLRAGLIIPLLVVTIRGKQILNSQKQILKRHHVKRA